MITKNYYAMITFHQTISELHPPRALKMLWTIIMRRRNVMPIPTPTLPMVETRWSTQQLTIATCSNIRITINSKIIMNSNRVRYNINSILIRQIWCTVKKEGGMVRTTFTFSIKNSSNSNNSNFTIMGDTIILIK